MIKGSWVALVTPMTEDGAVDERALAGLVEFHVDAGTDGLVIAGTTGESATLRRDEHVELVARAVELAAGRIPVMAGTGSNSTAQTLDLSLAVGQLGVVGYLIVTPYYNKPTQEGLYRHYNVLAEALDKPIMLYNVPGRTAVDLLPETVGRLAARGGFSGIKDATADLSRVAVLRELCGPDFSLLSGDDGTAREFVLAGGQGGISVSANVVPRQVQRMYAAALAGRAGEAAEIDAKIRCIHKALFVESNPIPVKWALERMGLIESGIRLPLTRLCAESQLVVEQALRDAGVTLP